MPTGASTRPISRSRKPRKGKKARRVSTRRAKSKKTKIHASADPREWVSKFRPEEGVGFTIHFG